MTTNHAFKIFNLPNIALETVLCSMNPVEFDPTFVPEYSILIYYAGDNVVHSFNTITTYLSDLFDVQPSFLSLNYKYLQDDLILKIMDDYCNVHNFELKDDVNKDYKIVNYNDQIIVSILKQQDSTLQLKLLFNPPPEFTFDFNSLRNSPVVIEIEHSHWITWNQLLEIKSENVYLCRSNFSNLDLKNLVQIWKNGWTPKWKWLMVQFKEDLDVDTLISERFMNIDLKDCQTSFILKDISTHAYKFRAEIHTFQGVTTKTGYHLTRPDHSIATVTVENNRIVKKILNTAPLSTAPLNTAPLNTAPLNTAPLSTAPLNTAPLNTAPLNTAPLSTAPLNTAPLNTAPLNTAPSFIRLPHHLN